MARELGGRCGLLVHLALGVLALAGAFSYAQDNTTQSAPPQLSSTTKIDAIGSAKPGDGSDTDKAWQSFLQSLVGGMPVAPPVPLGTSRDLPNGIMGILGGLLGGNAPSATPGSAIAGLLAGLPSGLAGQVQGVLNNISGLWGQVQGLLNGILSGSPPSGMPGGTPGGLFCGMFGGIAGITSNGNALLLDAVVELQSQTSVDLSALGSNAPQLPAPTLTLRGDVVVTGNNLPLMQSFDHTQPHLNASGVLVAVKGPSVYGIALLFGLSAQDWTGLRKLDLAPLPHLKQVLADGGKPLSSGQETALHIDLEEQLVDSAGNLAAAPGAHDKALDFTSKLLALWQATLGDESGYAGRLQALLSADQSALLQNTPLLLCAGKPRPVPAVDLTSLSITPNPAIVGQVVTFTVAVVGTDVKVAWDFGDGTSDTSNSLSVTHTYSSPGAYQVTITGSNATKSITRTTCLLVLTADGQLPPGADSGANGLALVINTLHALLKLDASALSIFNLSGVLPNGPAALAGAKVDITIGGQTVSFTLDNKGKGSNQGSNVQLKARAKRASKGAATTSGKSTVFRAKLALSQLPASLLDSGSTARSVKKTVTLEITIQINDQVYGATLAGRYVKNGKNARLSK